MVDHPTPKGTDEVLRRAANASLADYDPQAVIDAVNTLVPLGKDGALAAIDAYLASQDLESNPQESLLLVLRVLFEIPADPGHQPAMRLGGTSPPPPPRLDILPLFPLVLIDDVPLVVTRGYVLGGDTEPVTVHLRHFRETGRLRRHQLAPSLPTDEVLGQFRDQFSRAYGRSPSPAELALIESQLAKVYRQGTSPETS